MIFVKFSNFSEESLHVTFVTGGFLFYYLFFFIILFILVCKSLFFGFQIFAFKLQIVSFQIQIQIVFSLKLIDVIFLYSYW
ncbi:hypothetical protein BFS05_01870 [Gardnerella vaginalis]|uniref:Uncharacterized protein n=1 Tax=Gardnerella vaginalis TaxID=2702 RepID=A0A2K1SV08_GARVA|nr:hypothetical protein BFS05_01870 [Gardnerella vaginalis]